MSLVAGWIVCRRRRWISQVLLAAGLTAATHHSRFYRFFSRARWAPDLLGRCLFELLLAFLGEHITALVDDTLCRRAGPRIFGVSMHHDGAASSYAVEGRRGARSLACGHLWVVLAVRVPLPWSDKGIAIPVLARLYRSPKRCSKREYRKRTELAHELLDILADWTPVDRRLHLVGDREYACRTLLEDLPASIQFTGPMPLNAGLYGLVPKYSGRGRPRTRGRRLRSPAERVKDRRRKWKLARVRLYGNRTTKLKVMTWVCLWYRATGQRPVRVVVTRDPKGNFADRAFFSTDVEASPEAILERVASRWLIEVGFRDAKQHLGLTEPSNGWSRGKRRTRPKPGPQPRGNRGRRAVQRTTPFIWIVYGVVVVWYLREDRWKRDVETRRSQALWYTHKSAPSFTDMLDALRTEILALRLWKRPLPTRTLQETRQAVTALGLAA